MKRHLIILVVATCSCHLLVQGAKSDETIPARKQTTPARTTESTERDSSRQLTLEAARARAKLLSKVYLTTLEVLHDRYFHGERAIVPARAMEDIFADIERDERITARWIAVSLKAMSINHNPKSDFEKHAAREINAGKRDVERVEDGVYHRASAIPLRGGCISCHDSSFRPSTTAGVAGLVISIPLREADGSDEALQEK